MKDALCWFFAYWRGFRGNPRHLLCLSYNGQGWLASIIRHAIEKQNDAIIWDDMITAAIQAGGLSTRMGQNKALMLFLGQPLIAYMVRRLKELTDELVVTTNRPEDFTFLGVPLYTDVLPGTGALGGLYTALSVAQRPYVAVVACDMPFVKPVLLRAQYHLLLEESADVMIPRTPLGLEPLHAIYRRETCLPVVREALENGERKMTGWFSSVKVRILEPAEVAVFDPEFHSFVNVNNLEEFHRAEELARQME
jgi:molybdopterin-guanine dinucleotide biosynthesis protein A